MRGAFLKKCDEGSLFHLEQEIACSDEGSLFEKLRWGEPFWQYNNANQWYAQIIQRMIIQCDEESLFHLEQEIACSDEGSLFEKVRWGEPFSLRTRNRMFRWGEPFWKSAMRGAFLTLMKKSHVPMRGAFLKKCDEGSLFHLEQEIACSDEGSLFEKVRRREPFSLRTRNRMFRWGEPFWKSAMRGAFLKKCDEGSLFEKLRWGQSFWLHKASQDKNNWLFISQVIEILILSLTLP